ncbi:hypothetical protein GQ43DRAFT_5684 [Delitschia confertaspora ATCC 74209]|uniref:Uncharacterized protein n=1 Tax=Delitschia confertaspora ATCC 74209 TaxID=1513339 RepID=A0A9P4JTC7_9PLEO|nr:hypothetical protein GQ43DRAFT_5684 [Delitschia confertaspora ATCC 74209]
MYISYNRLRLHVSVICISHCYIIGLSVLHLYLSTLLQFTFSLSSMATYTAPYSNNLLNHSPEPYHSPPYVHTRHSAAFKIPNNLLMPSRTSHPITPPLPLDSLSLLVSFHQIL